MDRRIVKILGLISQDLSKRVSLASLARSVNLSPSRLRALCRLELGCSLLQHIRLMRLQRAQLLLDSTQMTIKEITVAVGWSDCSHFVRDFERAFGTSPMRYRNRTLSSIASRSGQQIGESAKK